MRARNRGVLALVLTLTLVCGPGALAAPPVEPPTVPASFAEVAAAALAASFVIRVPVRHGPADRRAIQNVLDPDEDIQEDGDEPLDAAAELRDRTVGAGVVIDPSGVALTSTRAILRAAEFEVFMMDGTPVNTTVVGLDLRSDVAVLKLDGRGAFFPHLPLGDSARVTAGDWVISVGAPMGLTGTVVAGVVTSTPSPVSPTLSDSLVQSDAMMGHGNAGGPLVNVSGEVIGLGVVLATDAAAHAIPSNTLRRILSDMLEKGRVSRPWLGITTQSLTPALARALSLPDVVGALVADLVASGPGAVAGLRAGDVIAGIGVTAISSRVQFERALSALAPGDVLALKVRRGRETFTVPAKLAEDPDGMPFPAGARTVRRRFGIQVKPINPVRGAVASDVDIFGAAGRAGIEAGDVIREVNGRPVETVADFEAAVRDVGRGATMLLRVQRHGVTLYVVIEQLS